MRRQTRLAAALLMSLGAAGLVTAQEMTPEKAQARREAMEQAAEARATHAAIQAAEAAERSSALQGPPPTRFDLDFPGGPLVDYVAAIRAQNPAANIVLSGDSQAAAAPQVSLKSVTTEAAIDLLSSPGPQETPSTMYWIHYRKVENLGSSEPVLVVYVRSQENRESKSSGPADSAVVSIAKLLRNPGGRPLSAENALSAIEVATSMVGAEPPTIRFHVETQLLMFRGTKAQVELLHETLTALEISSASMPE